jgi:hypothetical protein
MSTYTWYHIVATFNGSMISLYVNGNLKDSYSTTILPITTLETPLWIGGLPSAYFSGMLDDIAIFNRSLSSTEVARLYLDGRYALSEVIDPAYVNISAELPPGATQNFNFSTLGSTVNRTSVPFGTYVLRPSTYSLTGGFSDRVFTCN